MVPQDVVLFNDTIEMNIAYGKPGASHEEAREGPGVCLCSERAA